MSNTFRFRTGNETLRDLLSPGCFACSAFWILITATESVMMESFIGSASFWINAIFVVTFVSLGALLRFYPLAPDRAHLVVAAPALFVLVLILYRTYLQQPPHVGVLLFLIVVASVVYDVR